MDVAKSYDRNFSCGSIATFGWEIIVIRGRPLILLRVISEILIPPSLLHPNVTHFYMRPDERCYAEALPSLPVRKMFRVT